LTSKLPSIIIMYKMSFKALNVILSWTTRRLILFTRGRLSSHRRFSVTTMLDMEVFSSWQKPRWGLGTSMRKHPNL
jgi:hypothetical protein